MLAAALFVSPAAAQDAPLVLQPSSDWHMEYADDSCRLARQFGDGENASIFYIERYEPGDQFFLLVGGAPFAGRAHRNDVVRFGPDGNEQKGFIPEGELGDYKPALVLTVMQLLSDPAEKADSRARFNREAIASNTDVFGQKASPADENRISWFEVARHQGVPVRLMLGAMGEPLAAMRKCTDELLAHWGVDLPAHRGLTRAVAPRANPANWVTSSDYPSKLLIKGEQGIVQFRLSIDANGRPTQCHIQRSTRPEGFDKAVCNALMRRGRFDPALDADGQPIASYWRSTVRFVVPG